MADTTRETARRLPLRRRARKATTGYPAAYWLALAIPAINAIADATTNFFAHPLLNTGTMRGALVLPFVLYVLLTQPIWIAPVFALVAFFVYLFPLTLLSSEPMYSITGSYLQIVASMGMLPIGYRYFRSIGSLRRLHVALLIGAGIMVAQFLVAQALGLGWSAYVEDSFFVGGANVQATYLFALCVLLAPVMVPLARGRSARILIGVLLAVLAIFTLIILRRASIAAIVAGYLVYAFFAPTKTRVVRYVLLGLVLLMAAAPLYVPLLLPRWEARNLENRPLSEEARLAETFVVFDEFTSISPRHSLFGTEAFNSYGYFGVLRQLHVDWNILLHGTGLIGLLLYLLVHLLILAYFLRVYRRFRRSPFADELHAVFWAQVAAGFVISLSGSLTVIGYRAGLYLWVGAAIGTLEAAHVRAVARRRRA